MRMEDILYYCLFCSRFQVETLKKRGHNIKYLPYAFTEQGVAIYKLENIEEINYFTNKISEVKDFKIIGRFVRGKKISLDTQEELWRILAK